MPTSRRRNDCLPAACFLAVACLLSPVAPAAGAELIDRIVAVVNGEPITLLDLYREEVPVMGRTLAEPELRTTEDREKERQILQRMINERLLHKTAIERGIAIEPAEVDAAISEIRSRQRLGDEEFWEAIARAGMTVEGYKKIVSRQMAINRLLDIEVRMRTVVPPGDIEAYYLEHQADYAVPEQVRIRHLVVSRQGRTEAEAATRAAEARGLLAAGGDFREVAERFSDDAPPQRGEPSSFLEKDDVLAEFAGFLFGGADGPVSPVIATAAGFHVLKVEERRPASVRSLDEVRQGIADRLMEEKSEKRRREWFENLRRQAVIDIKL